MSELLCFIINNKNIYLEQTLVEYEEIPIFFLCKDTDQMYLVLCTDTENLNYVVTKISMSNTYKLLHGKLPMHDALLTQNEYWYVQSGEEPSNDIVKTCSTIELDRSILPDEGIYFEALTREVQDYVQVFDNEYFDLSIKYDMHGIHSEVQKSHREFKDQTFFPEEYSFSTNYSPDTILKCKLGENNHSTNWNIATEDGLYAA